MGPRTELWGTSNLSSRDQGKLCAVCMAGPKPVKRLEQYHRLRT